MGERIHPLLSCSSHYFIALESVAKLNIFLVLLSCRVGPAGPIIGVVKFDTIPD